uniref:Uncharacterized protein n=1 Tax=Fervidicoccus fontis TaxID=683846 RepID=A0A7J3ZJM1_9CREN
MSGSKPHRERGCSWGRSRGFVVCPRLEASSWMEGPNSRVAKFVEASEEWGEAPKDYVTRGALPAPSSKL